MATTGSTSGRLFVANLDARETFDLPGHGRASVVCTRAPGKQSPNEDAAGVFVLGEGHAVLAVADGVGGQPAGADAAATALAALAASLETCADEDEPVREAILAGFDRANREVLALGVGAATTLAVAEISHGRVRTYHVGDSAVLVFGGRGRLKLQTVFHSPVGYALEAGLLDEADAMQHEERHLISNVVGDPGMHVGMSSPVRLRPRDTVVIGSDGLFDNLFVAEIVEGLRRGPLERAVSGVAATCNERMTVAREGLPHKPDDLAVVAYRPESRGQIS